MPEILFDPIAHTYHLGSRQLPSVTTILKLAEPMLGIDYAAYEDNRERGKHVHLATHLYDQGDLDEGSLDDDVRGYLAAWAAFRRDTDFQTEASEAIVYHPKFHYAGTLDRAGTINGDPAILDIKTGAPTPLVGPQLAAYAAAWQDTHRRAGLRDTKPRCYAVYLRADGTYKLERYTSADDWSAFMSLLTLYHWREKHR